MSLVVVEGHTCTDRRYRLRYGHPSVQVGAFVFRPAPQPLDENVVEESAVPIHRYAQPRSMQSIRRGEGRELRLLMGIHDLGRADLVDGLV